MKIKGTNLETSNIGEFKEIRSNINSKDLGLALTMVSKNLYSNPIGSFIRELASNAVDANIDADVSEAVLIHIYQEGDNYYIEFKDNGTGMSPETFEQIYMSWFNSDKRDSNDKIGGWGIGSKSPLSYQDSFEIITRVDGIEYHYVLANEGSEPAATLLATNETDNSNGTTIRVEINPNDTRKVYEETIKQLAYFKRVYVKNDVSYYDNSFKLYESDKYILRNVNQPFGREMHICLGQVAYPINWNVLNMERINIPVGVKFKIGELDVTLSREEINYTEEVKKLVIERIEEVEEALMEKYYEQLQITDFKEYLNLLKGRVKPTLQIEDVTITMENVKATPKFSPLPDVKFIKAHLPYLFSYYSIEEIRGGRNSERHSSYHDMVDFITVPYSTLTPYLVTDRMNTYDSAFIGTPVALIKRNKVTRKHLPKLAIALGLMSNVGDYERNNHTKPLYKEGYLKTIFQVIKYIDIYISNKFTHYNGIADAEWIANYKLEQQELYEERKQTITHYTIFNNRETVNWGELIDKYKVIFYIDKNEDKKDVIAYKYLYQQLPEYFRKNSTFLIINPTVIKKIKNKPKFHPVEKIFKIKQFVNTLYRLKLSYRLENELSDGYFIFGYSKLYYRMYADLKRLYYGRYYTEEENVPVKNGDYNTTRTFEINIIEHFKEQFDKIKPSKNRVYMPCEEYIEELKVVSEKLDILRYVKGDIPHNYRVQIIEKLGVLKLDAKYYKREIND